MIIYCKCGVVRKVVKFIMLFLMVMFIRMFGGLGLKIVYGVLVLKILIIYGVLSV